MNATGTLSHVAIEWRAINWRQVNRNVRRLQIRIAEAMKQGRRGKVHALRRILTRSLGAACWAVRKVTESQGKKTPGIDGKTWSTPEEKQAAVCALQRGRHNLLPLRRIYIPKAGGKKRRPLGIPVPVSYCTSLQMALGLIEGGQRGGWPKLSIAQRA